MPVTQFGSHAFPASRQSAQRRLRQRDCAGAYETRQAGLYASFACASSHGCNWRFRRSDGAPPSASGVRWSSSKSTSDSSGNSSLLTSSILILFVQTVFVQPGLQIVSAIVSCVTAGSSGWRDEGERGVYAMGAALARRSIGISLLPLGTGSVGIATTSPQSLLARL